MSKRLEVNWLELRAGLSNTELFGADFIGAMSFADTRVVGVRGTKIAQSEVAAEASFYLHSDSRLARESITGAPSERSLRCWRKPGNVKVLR